VKQLAAGRFAPTVLSSEAERVGDVKGITMGKLFVRPEVAHDPAYISLLKNQPQTSTPVAPGAGVNYRQHTMAKLAVFAVLVVLIFHIVPASQPAEAINGAQEISAMFSANSLHLSAAPSTVSSAGGRVVLSFTSASPLGCEISVVTPSSPIAGLPKDVVCDQGIHQTTVKVPRLVSGGTSITFELTSGSMDPQLAVVHVGASKGAVPQPRAVVAGAVPSPPPVYAADNIWSGYQTRPSFGQLITSVRGDWTVPAVSCTAQQTSAGEWVGIDGWGSTSVEQLGTETDCVGGMPLYYTWAELFGDHALNNGHEVALSTTLYPIVPGDQMSASIVTAATGPGSPWVMELSDLSRGWVFAAAVPSPPGGFDQLSAEWIVESPMTATGPLSIFTAAHLANFGTVTFTGIAATESGPTVQIPTTQLVPGVMMNQSGTTFAIPGALDPTGTSFVDYWQGH
jgi:hypothetical protein